MLDNGTKTTFPSHAVSSEEKGTIEYGYKVGRAIEDEWFKKSSGGVRWFNMRDQYHRLRLYARGEQPIQKYKDELAIDGDLSYLNLDWKPVPIIPKFVDIVVNGMSERPYDITCYSQDPSSQQKRTDYIQGMLEDIRNKEIYNVAEKELGVSLFNNDPNKIPADEEEFNLHMQLDYKESIEIANEEAICNVFALNEYDDTVKTRVDYDLTTLGIGVAKHTFNVSEGIVLSWVDPADIVHSYTEDPYHRDIYYVGEIRRMSIPELKKNFPHLSQEEVEDIERRNSDGELGFTSSETDRETEDGYVYVMLFEYKTYEDQVYKIKTTASGSLKAIEKPDTFNPPKTDQAQFERVSRSIDMLYCGAKIIGHEKMLYWKKAENMTRPKSDTTKVNMTYSIVAPKLYRGMPESLVERMIGFADQIQIIHLKLQQVLSRMIPDGVFLDADGMQDVDLGNGTNYNPREALNMYFQTGSVVGRSMTSEGEFNHGKIPIQELNHSGKGGKIQSLIASYNYYLQMIRDVTGLNEARDGSTPDSEALVGLQKLAAANSNTATRHILNGGLAITKAMAKGVSLRISDVLEYANTREAFINSLGKFNVATLNEIKELSLHDFGVYIDLHPDAEEKQIRENNIQMALSRDQIDLDDAIDIREVKNLKLSNQLLKVRKKKRQQERQQQEMMKIQANAESQAGISRAAAEADVQKEQALAEIKAQLKKLESQNEMEKLEREAELKKELMYYEFQINMELEGRRNGVIKGVEEYKEDRKDKRTKLQAEQQSELISQRQNGTPPKKFESSGNDILGGGFSTEQFSPK